MDAQNNQYDEEKEQLRTILKEYYKNDENTMKLIDDVLNNRDYANKSTSDDFDKNTDNVIKITNVDDDTSYIPEESEMTNNVDVEKEAETDSVEKDTFTDTLIDISIKHPFITIGLVFGVVIFGTIKLSEHIIANGVRTGNLKTLKDIYRMKH